MGYQIDGVAIITGAGSGIGKACALAYAAEGARGLVVADLDYNSAVETTRECDSQATNPTYRSLAVAVDVTDMDSVTKMVQQAVETFGRIDYSVNSAGIGVKQHRAVDEVSVDEMNRFWQVNVLGTFNCVQAVTTVMKGQSIASTTVGGRERSLGRGVILNVASCNSYMAVPGILPYTTAKHGTLGLTRNAALDCAPYEIRVNAICPGWVDTPMLSAVGGLPASTLNNIPMRRVAQAEEVADVVLFMTSPGASYVTGVGWIVDGGTTLQLQT
ncbi:SDR family NAD(P)-dependent oxidoreductase [Aspergillus lucknowensis]|uniref:3-oxoacyl-reductase n=1 Tax=Aspergillus lucknowensis TaxID=176173 RepID=A0ABR4LCF5_9EURO